MAVLGVETREVFVTSCVVSDQMSSLHKFPLSPTQLDT